MSKEKVFITIVEGNKVTKKTIEAEEKPIKQVEEERKERQKKEA